MPRWLTMFAATVALGFFAIDAQAAAPASAGAPHDAKFSFLLFYKDRGAATARMRAALEQGLAGRTDEAAVSQIDVRDPRNRAVVDRFKVARAPMPLVVAVAPNGAITGMFATSVTPAQIGAAFVTPKMAQCMKSMQAGRLVFVCVSAAASEPVPSGVRDFMADPQFEDRTDLVSFVASDPAEAEFLEQLKIDPGTVGESTTALLAPPAVLVGKYGSTATKNEMAAALHAAGKCCNDPHCKHNHSH